MPTPTGYAVDRRDGRYDLQTDFTWTGPDAGVCAAMAAMFPSRFGYERSGPSFPSSPQAIVTNAAADQFDGTAVVPPGREPRSEPGMVY